MNAPLSRDEELLKFIRSYWNENRFPPSVRECGEHMGWRSPSTCHAVLRRLRDEGRLNFVPGLPRTLTVVER